MFTPQGAQCLIGEIWQRHQAILMSLATTDMDSFALAVDIPHLQRQPLAQAQSHPVGRQEKNPLAQFACGADQLLDLGQGEDIGKRLNIWGLDHLNPLPIAFQDVLPEELQAIAVDLDGAPGVGFDQFGEVDFNGAVAHTLEL